jgi:predicted Zn-dependent peptidase
MRHSGRHGVWIGLWLAAACCSMAACAEAPRLQRLELENGLVLLHQNNPNTLTAAVCCFIKVTALVETRETAGLRNLAQETVLDLPLSEGLTLGDRLSDLGLQATVQTSPDYVEAMFQGTADQLPELLRAVRVVLGNGKPAARQMNLRRAEVLRQLEERRELPLPVARDRAQAHLYRDTACSWPTIGTPALASITAAELLALRQSRYTPNGAVVSVSGNVSWEQCRQQAREALGDLLPGSVPAEPPAPPRRRREPLFCMSPGVGTTR